MDFTPENGIEIQENHLSKWQSLLKKEVYVALSIYAKKDNHLAMDGFEIKRGNDLSDFVENYLYYKSRYMLEEKLGVDGYKKYLDIVHPKTNKSC